MRLILLDDLLGLGCGVRHLYCITHKYLPSTEGIKLQWELEVGEEICVELWTNALENSHKDWD